MIARTSGESTMAHLKLLVLGSPRRECHGRPIELKLRKALALLVSLAVSGRPHCRDALATMRWPKGDHRAGRARLRRTLHRLNEALHEDLLVANAEAIRLRSADLWLDSAPFRRHVAAGLPAAPADLLVRERLAHLTTAIELYADDFLTGFRLADSPTFDESQLFLPRQLNHPLICCCHQKPQPNRLPTSQLLIAAPKNGRRLSRVSGTRTTTCRLSPSP